MNTVVYPVVIYHSVRVNILSYISAFLQGTVISYKACYFELSV